MTDFFHADARTVADGLVWLPQAGAATGPTGRPPNSFALLLDGPDGPASILFDAAYSWTVQGIRDLAETHPPAALVLSHRNVAGQADAFGPLADLFGIGHDVPILLHPDDQRHPEAQRGVAYHDLSHPAIQRPGLDVLAFPGHTDGSVVLCWEPGGVVLAGDSAVAPGPRQEPDPPRLVRPPARDAAADRALADRWRRLFDERAVRTVAPLHGAVYADRDDLPAIAAPLWDGEPMDPMR